jgi:hypothetical protein
MAKIIGHLAAWVKRGESEQIHQQWPGFLDTKPQSP